MVTNEIKAFGEGDSGATLSGNSIELSLDLGFSMTGDTMTYSSPEEARAAFDQIRSEQDLWDLVCGTEHQQKH